MVKELLRRSLTSKQATWAKSNKNKASVHVSRDTVPRNIFRQSEECHARFSHSPAKLPRHSRFSRNFSWSRILSSRANTPSTPDILPLPLSSFFTFPRFDRERLQRIDGRGADAFTALPRRHRTDRARPTTSVPRSRRKFFHCVLLLFPFSMLSRSHRWSSLVSKLARWTWPRRFVSRQILHLPTDFLIFRPSILRTDQSFNNFTIMRIWNIFDFYRYAKKEFVHSYFFFSFSFFNETFHHYFTAKFFVAIFRKVKVVLMQYEISYIWI